MPRATHYLLPGYTYHLTHRCHNREHHLKRAFDRDVYREWLLEAVKRHGVSVYAYAITHNHVHIVAHAEKVEDVSAMMHLISGATAKRYNLRTEHLGSMWQHPYQCTLVEGKAHLFNCLRYVDLNMVRAGVVNHPSEWKWCGYDELSGKRKRYCIIDRKRMLESLQIERFDDFKEAYISAVDRKLEKGSEREACWTESLAVGSSSFIKKAPLLYGERSRLYSSKADTDRSGAWTVREEGTSYA